MSINGPSHFADAVALCSNFKIDASICFAFFGLAPYDEAIANALPSELPVREKERIVRSAYTGKYALSDPKEIPETSWCKTT